MRLSGLMNGNKYMNHITIIDNPKIKTSELMDNLRKKFEVYSYWDNDELDNNFPAPKEETVRHFSLSATPDVLNKSWNELKDQREDIMTLREYILFFEGYYNATGKYCDQTKWTFFRDVLLDGYVAYGDFCGGKVEFDWSHPSFCRPYVGARLAISLNPSSTLSLESAIKVVKEAGYQVSKII